MRNLISGHTSSFILAASPRSNVLAHSTCGNKTRLSFICQHIAPNLFTFFFFVEGGGAEGGEVGVGVAVQYLKVFLEFLDIFSANFQIVQGNLEKMSMNIQNCQVRILFQKNMPSPKTGTCDEVPY